MHFLISTNAFYAANDIAAALKWLLPSATVNMCFREYYLEGAPAPSEKTIVISNGRTKIRDEYGQSIAICSSVARNYAKKHRLLYLPMLPFSLLVVMHGLCSVFNKKKPSEE